MFYYVSFCREENSVERLIFDEMNDAGHRNLVDRFIIIILSCDST